MSSPHQVQVAMGLDQVGLALKVGVLPIGEPPTGGSGPYVG